MNELFTSLLHSVGLAWWVEVKTETPDCTYYFGPFAEAKAAEDSKAGYVADLEQEGAQGITVSVKRCKPAKLTVSNDLGEQRSQGIVRAFSS
ncbi:DUF1816 domain-containing protein [Leptothermofonsia sichuanensis E412]|uniref:DUF1816 domain-containing protein n=1 Tax=Leptothermofonsia sichuanensis TaxID=2917832 RepID=UPI001CA71C8F|nr:DUF1816 domain-containing protein [Leptothermofonsia sichuanensis]QZZ19164.1 DUF1816 domain-containing protein [Leptothermofonsia sichuanensis E412]